MGEGVLDSFCKVGLGGTTSICGNDLALGVRAGESRSFGSFEGKSSSDSSVVVFSVSDALVGLSDILGTAS
jgi:hypothetical protein